MIIENFIKVLSETKPLTKPIVKPTTEPAKPAPNNPKQIPNPGIKTKPKA